MIRTFKYRLHPNQKQEKVLSSWLLQCAYLYNAALEQRISAYKKQGVSVTKYDQQKQLTELRTDPDWLTTPLLVQRSALHRIDEAFKAFFRRCKRGDKPGFPRFKSAKWYDSFSIGSARLTKDRIHIPKLGHVKLNLYRPIQGNIKNVKLRRDTANRWWACFDCDVGEATTKEAIASTIGIDLGLTSFATLSNGESVANPRYFQKSQELLAKRQQSLEHKKRGSKSRNKQRILVAKTHQKIKNQRLAHARKLAADLFKKYDLIIYENLNIKGMVQHPTLSKSISDASWNQFIRCLALKAENAGKHVIAVNPRNTSQLCSGCGQIVKKTLSDRQHTCPCGLSIDRDHNAAINILRLGQSLVASQSFVFEARPQCVSL